MLQDLRFYFFVFVQQKMCNLLEKVKQSPELLKNQKSHMNFASVIERWTLHVDGAQLKELT